MRPLDEAAGASNSLAAAADYPTAMQAHLDAITADGIWRATPDEDEHYVYAIAL